MNSDELKQLNKFYNEYKHTALIYKDLHELEIDKRMSMLYMDKQRGNILDLTIILLLLVTVLLPIQAWLLTILAILVIMAYDIKTYKIPKNRLNKSYYRHEIKILRTLRNEYNRTSKFLEFRYSNPKLVEYAINMVRQNNEKLSIKQMVNKYIRHNKCYTVFTVDKVLV